MPGAKLVRMDFVFDLLAFSLMAIALAPLLLLGLYVIADRFKFAWAQWLLKACVELLKFQWVTGGLLNLLVGFALAVYGGWMVYDADPTWQRVLSGLLVPFGLWRMWRGAVLLG
jgi:hypothetical protein